MGGGIWQATVHGVTKSWTRLNDFTFTLGSAQQGPLRQAIMYDYNESECRTVMSDPLRPHGLYSSWNPPGQNTGVVAYPFSSGSSRSRNRMRVSCIAGIFFTNWAIREAMIIMTKATKSQWKKQFPTWNQNWLLLCNKSRVKQEKENWGLRHRTLAH